MTKNITYKPFGNQVVLIEWDAIISDEILNDILEFKRKIEHQKENDFSDLIVCYNSLTIRYKEPFENFDSKKELLQSIYFSKIEILKQSRFLWEIPVCYNEKFGIDLEEIASTKNISIEKIIQLHSENTYQVFFIGFLPGFLYLGGLNQQLFVDRKSNPRLKVTQGAVAIGGQQTGVYPLNSPGGWNIIGKTPILFFDVNSEKPCFAKPGDKIKFKSISIDEYVQIENEVAQKTYQLSKTLLDD